MWQFCPEIKLFVKFVKYICSLGRGSNTTLRILSVTPFSLKKIRKGGEGGTPQIRNLFLVQNQVFFEQKTPFLALFKKIFRGKIRKGGEGGTPQIHNLFFEPKSGVFEQRTQCLALF